jgi:hypothetical protein
MVPGRFDDRCDAWVFPNNRCCDEGLFLKDILESLFFFFFRNKKKSLFYLVCKIQRVLSLLSEL